MILRFFSFFIWISFSFEKTFMNWLTFAGEQSPFLAKSLTERFSLISRLNNSILRGPNSLDNSFILIHTCLLFINILFKKSKHIASPTFRRQTWAYRRLDLNRHHRMWVSFSSFYRRQTMI